MTSSELGYELAFLPRLHAPPLKFCGLPRGTGPLPATGEARSSVTRLAIIQPRMPSLPWRPLRRSAELTIAALAGDRSICDAIGLRQLPEFPLYRCPIDDNELVLFLCSPVAFGVDAHHLWFIAFFRADSEQR
jgi:hypothetical protein